MNHTIIKNELDNEQKKKLEPNAIINGPHKKLHEPQLPPRAQSLYTKLKDDAEAIPSLKIARSTPLNHNLYTNKIKKQLSHFHLDSFENIKMCQHSLHCSSRSSLKKCMAIKGIICALKYYQSLDIISDNNSRHISTFLHNIDTIYTMKRLLDDFIHIQLKHSDDLEALSSFIISKLSTQTCNMDECISLARHHRDRNLDRDHDDDEKQDDKWVFTRDLFDNIHSYIFHTFDVGLRMQQNIKQNEENIAHHLKKTHKKLKTFGRFKGNKYCIGNRRRIPQQHAADITWIDGLFDYISKEQEIGHKEEKKLHLWMLDEEYDTESIQMDTDDIKNMHESNIMSHLNQDKNKLSLFTTYNNDGILYESSFSTGYIFYYWSYYRTTSEAALYIARKYGTIREEVLNNAICRISCKLFKDILKKAEEFMKSKRVKCMSSSNDYLHCGIKKHSAFTMDHLLALIFYCDCSDLCSAFSATFRKKRSFDSVSSIKKRNREYWNLSKLLRECVALFGEHKGYFDDDTREWMGVIGPFYCGMSFCCVLAQFNIELNAPTSSSKHIEVASRFGGDHGVIIEFNNNFDSNSAYIKCFNCCWISNFHAEDERLFFASKYRLRVQSIQDIESQINYKVYFHALFYFDCMINGTQMERNTDDKIHKRDEEIMRKLIQYQLHAINNGFPKYINDTFRSFCVQKREIVLNLHSIWTHFVDLKHLILGMNSCLVNGTVFKLFKNLETIVMYTTDRAPYKEYSFALRELSQNVLDSRYNANNVRVVINADCHFQYQRYNNGMAKSWITVEFDERNTSINCGKYVMEITTHKEQNMFTSDCLVVFRK